MAGAGSPLFWARNPFALGLSSASVRWISVLILPTVVLGLWLVAPVPAEEVPEQRVTPITPEATQRVEALTPPETQRVEALDAQAVENVSPPTRQTTAGRIASNTGKAVLAVMALGVSLGVTVASLLFL
jgi:hypothetical protein